MSDGYVFYNYTWYPHEDIIQGEPISVKLHTATSNTDPLIARWEWREATSSDWVVIKEETAPFPTDSAGNYLPLTCDFSLSTENSIIRLSLFDAILKEKDTPYSRTYLQAHQPRFSCSWIQRGRHNHHSF